MPATTTQPPMRFDFHVLPGEEEVGVRAADWLAAELRRTPAALVGLATGKSPARAYELLAERRRAEPALLAQVRVLKIDEWGGLAMDDPGTCEVYLQEKVIRPWGVTTDRYFGWQSRPADPQAECERVRGWLAENGPMDVCVLGLGVNGHLLMNEPDDHLVPGPHVAALAETTMQHGMLKDTHRAPQFGLCLGMADILRTRKILLLVSGRSKAVPLARLLEPKVTPHLPASFLWLHPAVTVLCDRAAAGPAPPLKTLQSPNTLNPSHTSSLV